MSTKPLDLGNPPPNPPGPGQPPCGVPGRPPCPPTPATEAELSAFSEGILDPSPKFRHSLVYEIRKGRGTLPPANDGPVIDISADELPAEGK
jgi:hypothetical protein